MYTDARISAALDAMIRGIEAPPACLPEIQQRIANPPIDWQDRPRGLRLAIAIAGIAAVIFVLLSTHVIQTIAQNIEDRFRAALQEKGGFAPPPPPESLWHDIQQRAWSLPDATFAIAQSRVPFTLVPPAGLPHDVVSARIRTAPTGVYSPATHSWRIGPSVATFIYRRKGGRTFQLLADQFDPQSEPYGKYIFEADASDTAPDGTPGLVRHDIFYWRNGNQVMSAIDGKDISAREIEAIRTAMHGVPLPQRWPNPPQPGAIGKIYTAPCPQC